METTTNFLKLRLTDSAAKPSKATAATVANNKSKSATNSKAYKIRFNEKVTTKKVNAILDKIDACGGYCPCQPQSASSKCHCKDFLDNKGIGEVCICGIYIKQKA